MKPEPRTDRRRWEHRPAALGKRKYVGHFVYFIHDAASNELLYIGCTNNIRRRASEHHATGAYRRDRVWYEIEGPFTKDRASIVEAGRIATLRPINNVRPWRTRAL